MTRKHFIAIASVLRDEEAHDDLKLKMAEALKQFNENFNTETFLSAAGYRNTNKENK